MEVQKCDEKTALEEIKRIADEQAVGGLSIDSFLSGGENSEQNGTDDPE